MFQSYLLGIGFDNHGKILGIVKVDEFKKPYKKIVKDVALGVIDSRKYNNKEQRKSYIDSLPEEFKPTKKWMRNLLVLLLKKQKWTSLF